MDGVPGVTQVRTVFPVTGPYAMQSGRLTVL